MATGKRIKPEHLDTLRQRAGLIEDLRREAQEHGAQARRAELLAQYAQEALTAWLSNVYHLNLLSCAWHLDLDHMRLEPIPPPPEPEGSP